MFIVDFFLGHPLYICLPKIMTKAWNLFPTWTIDLIKTNIFLLPSTLLPSQIFGSEMRIASGNNVFEFFITWKIVFAANKRCLYEQYWWYCSWPLFDVLLVRLNVFTRDLVVAKRRPVVVWIHGGSFSRFKIVLALTFFMTVWLVFYLQRTLNSPRKKNRKKHLWYSATNLEAPRLSMILTTCLTRKLFLSPFNTGSVVALSIAQTPRCK